MSCAHGYHACARTEMRDPWFPDARLIAKAPNLLAVCSLGAGYDVIDVDACTKAGILVCNQSGANKEAVAEHAVGLMLALSKKIMETDRAVRQANNSIASATSARSCWVKRSASLASEISARGSPRSARPPSA